MIPRFDPNATYAGKPLAQMTVSDLQHALAYKVHELRQAYLTMTPEQMKEVARKMESVLLVLDP